MTTKDSDLFSKLIKGSLETPQHGIIGIAPVREFMPEQKVSRYADAIKANRAHPHISRYVPHRLGVVGAHMIPATAPTETPKLATVVEKHQSVGAWHDGSKLWVEPSAFVKVYGHPSEILRSAAHIAQGGGTPEYRQKSVAVAFLNPAGKQKLTTVRFQNPMTHEHLDEIAEELFRHLKPDGSPRLGGTTTTHYEHPSTPVYHFLTDSPEEEETLAAARSNLQKRFPSIADPPIPVDARFLNEPWEPHLQKSNEDEPLSYAVVLFPSCHRAAGIAGPHGQTSL